MYRVPTSRLNVSRDRRFANYNTDTNCSIAYALCAYTMYGAGAAIYIVQCSAVQCTAVHAGAVHVVPADWSDQ